MTIATLLVAFGLASAFIPEQVSSAPTTDSVPQNEVQIPFEPPLGETLRYRYTRTDSREGQTRSHSVDMQVRFARDGDNYAMMVEFVVPDGVPVNDPGTLLMSRPLEIAISPGGEVLGLTDEESYWESLQSAISAEIQRGAPVPDVQARVGPFLERLRVLPADERLALMTSNFLPIVGAAGAILPLDEEFEFSETRQTAIGEMTQQSRVRTERTEGHSVRVTTVMTVPPGETEQAMVGLLREFAPDLPTAQQLRVGVFEDRTVQIVSLSTGLTDHWEMRRLISFETDGAITRIEQSRTIEKLP